jgi:hypothetical protein
MSQSQVATQKDEKTFVITLTGDQRKLLLYTGAAIGVYFLLKSLVKSSVRKLRENIDMRSDY